MRNFLLPLLLFPVFSFSQITDNFSDGNFTFNPTWSGNDTDFVVNANQQLQLNSSGTSESYLSLANTQPLANCEWNFWIHLNFSPSSSNYARVYLVSDTNVLSGNLNGYYLQFGETGGNDRVRLFKQTGNSSDTICSGTTLIANAFSIRVKVTRDNTGLWKLLIDPTGGTNYALEASGTDNTFNYTSYFGVYCVYTTTNATNFFFDDFYIYAPPDIVPPKTDSIKLISQNQIDVYFDESVSLVSAQTPANYSVYPSIGYSSSALRDASNFNLAHLTFANNFSNGQHYTLTVTGVQDLAGNTDINDATNFLFFVPQANDIMINEIMADINPAPNSLPAYEYLELFNRTNFSARLSGWTISDAVSTTTIPDITIQPDSFYMLTSTVAAPVFGNSIQVVGVPSFPSLNDAGDNMILRDANGNIISTAFYNLNWYHDPIKQNGGWSLEQINPNSPCGGQPNWKASADISGGTPGRKNSVYSSVPDVTPPKVSYATVLSANSIQLFFSESLDSTTLTPLTNYSIDNGIGNPVAAIPVGPDYTSVKLTFASPIISSTIYTITVSGVSDCAGNVLSANNTTQFAIPDLVSPNDIVVNEVLFDPLDNGVEWIEIYNRSNKIIDLKEIYLCSQDNYGNLTSIYQTAPEGRLMFPKDYIVLSKDQNAIKTQYYCPNEEEFVDMSSIPSLNNDSDYVLLVNASSTIIDKLHYYSSWHLPLLTSTKGISLERINYNNPTQDASNWHSAAETVNATPAYKNSQYTNGEGGTEVNLSPEVFSPDNDGYNDVLSINYSFDVSGMVGNINIYDSRGRLVKMLMRNQLLAASGTFFWDGITDDKLKADIGIYIVYFEAFDLNGKVKKFKKTCVLAGKL